MSSLFVQSFAYISEKTAAIAAVLVTSRPATFSSSVIPSMLKNEQVWPKIVQNHKTDDEKNLLHLCSQSETMQFTPRLVGVWNGVIADPDIIIHLLNNTRYFSRSIKILSLTFEDDCPFFKIMNTSDSTVMSYLEKLNITGSLPSSSSHNQQQYSYLDAFKAISKSTSLRELRLFTMEGRRGKNHHLKITDDDLAPLSSLTNLRSLDLNRLVSIRGHGLKALAGAAPRSLRKLHLNLCPEIDSGGLKEGVAKLTSLTDLSLDSDKITDDGMVAVASSVAGLRRLRLCSCNQVTDESIVAFSQNCPLLEHLHFNGVKGLTNVGLDSLAKNLDCLRSLYISSCESLPLHTSFKNFQGLDSLVVISCFLLGDDAVKEMCEITSLTELTVSRISGLEDTGLVSLSNLSSLKKLSLSLNPQITDDGLRRALVRGNDDGTTALKSLEMLDISRCQQLEENGEELARWLKEKIPSLVDLLQF